MCDVAIESDDEARRAAEAIIADIGSGHIERAEDFIGLYGDPRDASRVWSFVLPVLTDAVKRHRTGDGSPAMTRLAAFARVYNDAVQHSDGEAAAAKAERAAERRAATVVAIQPAPDIADRMIGVGLHGIPLPDDAMTDGNFLVTRVATPEGLVAFYIEHLRATGWTLDLDHSAPLASSPQCYFSRPNLPGRYISVLTGPGSDVGRTLLSISEHDD